MYRLRNTKKTTTKAFIEWATQNRMRSSVLVFAFIVFFGSVFAFTKYLENKNSPLAATSMEVSKSGEIPGWWYNDYFGASTCESKDCEPSEDPDKDKLTNYQEYFYGSDPKNKDTNANGNTDGEDVALGFVPHKAGKVTFEEAGADDNILGESLAYNNEVKGIISDMTDFTKVVLPEVNDAELNIVKENSKENFVDYILAMNEVSAKYANSGLTQGLDTAIKQQNESVLLPVKQAALRIAEDYKRVPVPQEAVTLHKYHIALWETLPRVITTPQPDATSSFDGVFNEEVNAWYDSVQVVIALNQKIAPELQSLRNKYSY